MAVVCWQGVLQIQSNVGCSTIPGTTRDQLVEPKLAPLPWAPGAVEPMEPVLPPCRGLVCSIGGWYGQ